MSADLTSDNFARFLSALDPDPERAGIKYEQLRAKLIKIFVAKACPAAEDLADEVINRVVAKIEVVEKSGDVIRYSYAVAKYVYMESIKGQKRAELMDDDSYKALKYQLDSAYFLGPTAQVDAQKQPAKPKLIRK